MPDLRDGAHAIVGLTLDKDRDAARPVAFIGDVFDGCAGDLTRAALDRVHHGVLRHVEPLGVVHRFAKPGIAERVAAAAGGNGQFLDELRERPAALSVNRSLLVLD